jgi:hypothetical protein
VVKTFKNKLLSVEPTQIPFNNNNRFLSVKHTYIYCTYYTGNMFRLIKESSSGPVYKYRSWLLCNASIYFNKQCLAKKVTPKYANLRFTNNSPVAQLTTNKAQVLRIKNEIKFLLKKKEITTTKDLYLYIGA